MPPACIVPLTYAFPCARLKRKVWGKSTEVFSLAIGIVAIVMWASFFVWFMYKYTYMCACVSYIASNTKSWIWSMVPLVHVHVHIYQFHNSYLYILYIGALPMTLSPSVSLFSSFFVVPLAPSWHPICISGRRWSPIYMYIMYWVVICQWWVELYGEMTITCRLHVLLYIIAHHYLQVHTCSCILSFLREVDQSSNFWTQGSWRLFICWCLLTSPQTHTLKHNTHIMYARRSLGAVWVCQVLQQRYTHVMRIVFRTSLPEIGLFMSSHYSCVSA